MIILGYILFIFCGLGYLTSKLLFKGCNTFLCVSIFLALLGLMLGCGTIIMICDTIIGTIKLSFENASMVLAMSYFTIMLISFPFAAINDQKDKKACDE